MIKLTLGNITMTSIGHSSGFFMGEQNTHKNFRSEKVVYEMVGDLSGNENTAIDNYWVKNILKWEDE
ncbi:hypothetical protein ACFOU2_19480 [Bacillus songklensis]|uniref:Uncharacterized protein n=1 Tax=Bacillus songklensis TaxID=1069116 RepID=A0ABV8B7T4_9BACI